MKYLSLKNTESVQNHYKFGKKKIIHILVITKLKLPTHVQHLLNC